MRDNNEAGSCWFAGEIGINMVHVNESESLAVPNLLEQYRSGSLRPTDVIDAIYQRIEGGDDHVWISLLSPDEARAGANRTRG